MNLAQVSNTRAARGRATVYAPPFFKEEDEHEIVLVGGCWASISSESFDAAIIAAMICTEWEGLSVGEVEDLRRAVV